MSLVSEGVSHVRRAAYFSPSCPYGGASIAAARIALSLEPRWNCTFLGANPNGFRAVRKIPNWLTLRIQVTSNPVHRSVNLLRSGVSDGALIHQYDIAHLHWVGDELLGVKQIGRLSAGMPVVWTLHDTWAFTGADHHPKDDSDARYQVGYTRESRLPGDGRIDVDAWVFRRKLRAWGSPMWLAAPSRHVKQMAQKSFLASSWPVTVIPNPLNVDVFRPLDEDARVTTRLGFGLAKEEPLVVFGSGSRAAHTKGMDLLAQTLHLLHHHLPKATFATFGPIDETLPSWVRQLGYIQDEEVLRSLYAAADAVVVSSRFETFSQVASEAQACGTPVAAFATSGLLDVVDDHVTGYLAKPFEPASLANAVVRVLEAGPSMRDAARKRAERLWAMDVVGRQYVDWYEQAMREYHAKAVQ